MNFISRFFTAAAILFAAGAFLGAADLEPLKAGYLPTAEHVLYFIAKEKGFFKQEGLNVELFRFTNSAEGLASVKTGKLDVGFFGTAAPLAFIANGAEFTIFGGGGGEGAALVAKPEKAEKYKELKDLKGASIGVVRLATGDVVFRAALHEAGLDWKKDLAIKEFDSPAVVLEAVKKGELDAGVLWIPYYTLAATQGLKIIKYSGDILKNHTCCRQTALTANLKEHPEEFRRFLLALLDSYRFYVTNRDETVDIVLKYVQVDKGVIKEDLYGGHLSVSPDPNKKSVEQFNGFMKESGYIPKDSAEIGAHINTALYAAALAELEKRDPNDAVWKSLKQEFNDENRNLSIKTY